MVSAKKTYYVDSVKSLNFTLGAAPIMGYPVRTGAVLHIDHFTVSKVAEGSDIKKHVSECIKNFANTKAPVLYVIFSLIESGNVSSVYQKIIDSIIEIADYYSFWFNEIKVFRPEYCEDKLIKHSKVEIKNIFVDTFYPFTYNFMYDKVDINYTLNLSKNKALFLVGKPLKAHRLPLLYTMSKMNMIPDHVLHSFHKDLFGTTSYTSILNLLQKYSDPTIGLYQTKKFVKTHTNIFDIRDGIRQGGKSVVYQKVFNETFLDVITETFADYTPFFNMQRTYFTEKTVLPLLMGRPFLHYSLNSGVHKELELQGYRTFASYTNINDHSELTDAGKFCTALKSCLTSAAKKSMYQDAIYNKQLAHNRLNSETQKLYTEFPDLQQNNFLLKYMLYKF